MQIDILQQVMLYLRPDCHYSLYGDDTDNIDWLDTKKLKPTIKEFQDAIPIVRANLNKQNFADRVAAIELAMHRYINSRYNPELQNFFIGIAVRHLIALVSGQPSPYSEEKIEALKAVWEWIESIVAYYAEIVAKLQREEEVTDAELNWTLQFDGSDPGYSSLAKLPQ